MNIDNDEIIIKKALNTIRTPESNIKSKVHDAIEKRRITIYFKRAAVGISAVCLSIILCLPAMASNISSFKMLLSRINSEFETFFKPIQIVSEDKGIKMEVITAINDNEMAVVYLTMQDLTGDRVDNTIDLYDYKLSKASMFTSEVVNYDKASKTATIRMQANGGDKLSGKELSFSVDSFLSGRKEIKSKIDKNIFHNLLNTSNPKIVSLDMNNNISGGSGNLFEEYKKMDNINILKPNEINIDFPEVDFVHISNIGLINGMLHIQTIWTGEGKDDHGYLYFTDKLGNKLNINYANIHFSIDEKGNTIYGRNYTEYIFDIGSINLNEVYLNGDFITNKNYVQGKWDTKFKIKPINGEKQIDCNIKIGTGKISKVSISPLGITLSGENLQEKAQQISLKLNMLDDTNEILENAISFNDNGKVKLKFIAKKPLNSSQVESINIDGEIINMKRMR